MRPQKSHLENFPFTFHSPTHFNMLRQFLASTVKYRPLRIAHTRLITSATSPTIHAPAPATTSDWLDAPDDTSYATEAIRAFHEDVVVGGRYSGDNHVLVEEMDIGDIVSQAE
jgi:hypothetical protein